MRRKKLTRNGLRSLATALSLALLGGTACHKGGGSLSPEKAKKQRLAWNLKTTVEAYNRAGFANSHWDGPARQALTEFARGRADEVGSNEPWSEIISTNAAAAVEAGCNDPMVNYLFIKFSMSQTNSREAFLNAFCKMARDMNGSSYSAMRKAYASARALDQSFYTYGTNAFNHPETSEMMWMLFASVQAAMNDRTTPEAEVNEISELALHLASGNEQNYDQFYHIMEKPMFQNWPDAYTPWFEKGKYYIHLAWKARGGGYANEVTAEGWTGFSNNLAIAQDALEHAWKLNPKKPEIAEQMMSVMLGQGGGRDRMETWFNRAMDLNTNDYDACYQKLFYLEPKWYGSDEDELAFGRECLESTKWGGRVPLILVDAHAFINSRNQEDAQTNYWKQPEVWADVKAAYERFFELNPDDDSYYQNYAWHAYHAEQWDKLNELLPKLGPANYDFFGGEEEFNKMVLLARAHRRSNSP
jgi:Domain of unknown function (DUF4034)